MVTEKYAYKIGEYQLYVLIENYLINAYIFRIKNHCYIGRILYFYPRWNKANSYRKNIEMKQVQKWVLFFECYYNELNISLD